MADEKLPALTELTTPAGGDMLYIVDDPGGTPLSKRITRSNLLQVGVDVQAFGAVLDDLNALGANSADGEFLVGTGPGAVAWESGATARTSLGLGTTDTPEFDGLVIGNTTGIDVNPGSDVDADLITVGVTGAPILMWDESEDSLSMNKGLQVTSGELKVGADSLRFKSALNRWGMFTGNPQARLDISQFSTTGTLPVLLLEQLDISEEFVRFEGSAASAVLTQSIVAEGDVSTATRQGFLKVYVQDDGNQITDQAYYLPIYTLA